jgi:hypothetical protein
VTAGRPGRPVVSTSMRPYAAVLVVVLAIPSPAAAQTATAPAPVPAPPAAAAPSPARPSTAIDVERVKRRLDTETPLLDAALSSSPPPTFRVSVTQKVDIWKFWGEPDEVAAYVRARGGTWHSEFQAMVTPDEFKGYGGILGNGEKLQLAATSFAFAAAMKLLGIGIDKAKDAAHSRSVSKAKEEVQRELEAFYQLHPEARPAATPP